MTENKRKTDYIETLKLHRDIIRQNAETCAITFYSYQSNLLCNLFALNHPELNLKFPIRNDKSMIGGYIGGDENILKKIRNEKVELHSITKRHPVSYSEYIITKLDDILKKCEFEDIDIRDKESFKVVYDYFVIMEAVYDKIHAEIHIGEINWYENPCFFLSQSVAQKYFELIGYWTAKEENRINNPGGLAMKKRGEKNREVIKALLADLEIKSLGVFRTNKALRKKFYDMAKQLTDCDSEDRISKIARLILNVKPVLTLQKKP
jgi:hypothetical protein